VLSILVSCAFVSEQNLQDRLQALDTNQSSLPVSPSDEESSPTNEESSPTNEEPSPTNEDNLDDPCAETVALEYTFEILENVGCSWGEYGNGMPEQGRIQARKGSFAAFAPEGNQKICDVQFEFESQFGGQNFPFGFDDQMLILLNQHVVFASHKNLLEPLSSSLNSSLFAWEQLVGAPMEYNTEYWLLGTDSVAVFPEPGIRITGDSFLKIDSMALNPLRTRILEENHIDLRFIAFGDNDDTDCYLQSFATTLSLMLSAQ